MTNQAGRDSLLAAVFSRIDARPDFDTRLMQRLRAEAGQANAERARKALELEQLRHRVARQELNNWRRWTQALTQAVTLERIGMVALAVGVVTSAVSPDQLRTLAPLLVTGLGVLLALAPVVATVLERRP